MKMVKNIKIEKGIPFPGKQIGYPFGQMKVGESFKLPAKATNIMSAAYYYAKTHGIRFSRRGNRVWRTK